MDKRKWVFLIIIVVAIIVLILSLRCCNSETPTDSASDQTAAESKGLDFTPANGEGKSIKIPTMNGINFKAEQLKQTVDFFNPSENNCYFVLSLYLSDDTLIYQSERIAPSEHITEITLLQALQRGVYGHCRLVYSCYALDGEKRLNGTEVVLEINSY